MSPLESNTGDMTLRITVRINDDEIADYEVRNTGAQTPTGKYVYSVTPLKDGVDADDPMLTVTHHRNLGPISLAANTLTQVALARDVAGTP
jgi:hypothetical protein